MTESAPSEQSALPANDLPPGARPEELPPVEPPSAGFIVQLFLIPALIVAAVIGVWALFGKLADSETNWPQLVAELGSGNEHRRWRAALGLAQALRNQQVVEGENGEAGESLAEKPEVAKALCDLLNETLNSPSTLQEDIDHREFLTRTLGSLKCNDIVLPTLNKTLSAERNIEVRKSGLMSVALIAQRAFQQQAKSVEVQDTSSASTSETVLNLVKPFEQATIATDDIFDELRIASQDEDASIRQLAAFALGMVSGPDAVRTLKAMLLDGDSLARANAAVGLARNGVADAADALIELLDENLAEIDRDDFSKLSEEDQQEELRSRQFVRPTLLRNCIRASGGVYGSMSDAQKELLLPLLKAASEDSDASVSVEADTLLNRIAG